MADNALTECIACGEMLENEDVTYCLTCDAPICHCCQNGDETCAACPPDDDLP